MTAPAGAARGRASAARALADAALAVAFLTRLPVPAAGALRPGGLGRAVLWFPVVGALVGGVLGATRLVADLALPPGAGTAIALAAAILVTGGLHEDGLADTADGLGAHADRERRLEIMRDPRVGAFGALALFSSLLIAWTLLAPLGGEDCLRAAVVAHVLARWAMPIASTAFRPARADGAGRLMAVAPGRLAVTTVLAVAVACAAAGPLAGLLATGAALLATLALGAYVTRALGGITGDTYGATGKLVELVSLATVVAVWG